MKIGGVFMPGDLVPRDELPGNRVPALNDTSELGATEEVMEDSPETDTDFLLNHDYGRPQTNTSNNRKTEHMEQEPESNYIYACNICGEQYPVKEECENHLRIHTGSECLSYSLV